MFRVTARAYRLAVRSCFLRQHTSHAVCGSISACMCDALQFCNVCEDILVPFIMDSRMPDDTIFWIVEEDFRFWPPGCDPDNADNYKYAMEKLLEKRYYAEVDESGSSLPPSQGLSLPPSQPRPATQYHTSQTQGDSIEEDVDKGFCRDVVDMMRIATMCDREGMGDFIWVSWVPNKQKPSRIGHGSQCIMVTKPGMAAVLSAKDRGLLKRGHIDLVLQAWLLNEGEAKKARACYIYPPIGSYTEHASECDPKNFGEGKTRPSGFDSGENPCHGTRLFGDLKERTKAFLQWKKGWADRPWIPFAREDVLHGTDKFLWKSYEDENAAQSVDYMMNHPVSGQTKREKRMFRSFRTRMMKRNWVKTAAEAKCVKLYGKMS